MTGARPRLGRRANDGSGRTLGSGPLPQGTAKSVAVRSMFDAIADRYELCNRLLTFSLDRRWRAACVRALSLAPGATVLDLACGTGDLCRELEAADYRPVGADLSWGMLAHARTTGPLLQADAIALPFGPGSVDGVTCGFALRNLPDLADVFAELARVVRPGGRLSLLEVAEPDQRLLRLGHAVYFRHVVPMVGGWLSDRDAYRYLPRSVAYLPPRPVLLGQLRSAGFTAVEGLALTGGVAQLLTATRSRNR